MLFQVVNSSGTLSSFNLSTFIIDKASDFIIQFLGVIIGAAIAFLALKWQMKRDEMAKKESDKESLKLYLKRVQKELANNGLKMSFIKVACGFTSTYGASMELLSEISNFYEKEFKTDAYNDLMSSALLIKPGLLKNNEEVLIKLLTLYNNVDLMFYAYKINALENFYPNSRVSEYQFEDVNEGFQKLSKESSEITDEILSTITLITKAIIELCPNEKADPEQQQFWNMGLFKESTIKDTKTKK